MTRKRIRSQLDEESDSIRSGELAEIAKMVAEILKPTIQETIRATVEQILKESRSSFQNSGISDNNPQPPRVPWGCPPPAVDPSFYIKMAGFGTANPQMVLSKSKSAVIEKLPEGDDDNAAVLRLLQECALDDKLDPEKQIHRHPATPRTSDGHQSKPRIIKVPFVDQKSRDAFLRKLPQVKKQKSIFCPNVFVRRDMTPPELDLLYFLRRHAFSLNLASGLFEYIVVDLQLKRLTNPKPFKAKEQQQQK
ncbi:hypothetical protein niasHT_038925 [Heterodera trifolii]|uniref:Uncharacterized protein n=1 Tax=Heterodera trifolii TaxID=157864 RepID=A0ABD2IM15_9BILA